MLHCGTENMWSIHVSGGNISFEDVMSICSFEVENTGLRGKILKHALPSLYTSFYIFW